MNNTTEQKAKALMDSIYIMLSNPMKDKVDILSLIKSNTENNPELVSIFGNIKDEFIEEVKQNNIDNSDDTEENIVTRNENGNFQFEVIDVAAMDKNVKHSFTQVPTREEARFLEDIYYQTQRRRIAVENQIRSLRQGKDNDIENEHGSKNMYFLEWYMKNLQNMEDQIKKALDIFSDTNYLSKWAKKVVGIGPTIATCLVANLDIKEDEFGNPITHAASWWEYCGLNNNRRPWLSREKSTEMVNKAIEMNDGILDDTAVYNLCNMSKWKFEYYAKKCTNDNGNIIWNKDKLIKATSIIPYNKNMKILMYKIGHSFMFSKNKPNSVYGSLLKKRMEYETMKNERGDYAEQAAEILRTKNIGKSTIAYKYYSKGQLPPAHIAQRCQRYVTKLFISHLYEAAYYNKYGKQAPMPYILQFGDDRGFTHADYIGPEVPYDSVTRDKENF